LGLIGGSFAKAVKAYTPHSVQGVDRNPDVCRAALSCGAADAVFDPADCAGALQNADITLLCLYPEDAITFTEKHADSFKPDSVVADACGVKRPLSGRMNALAAIHGFYFVGGHPMAGLEHGGFENSTAALFKNASFIITPEDAPQPAVNAVTRLMLTLGFKTIKTSNPKEHDEMIAYTSQLPHVLACAYVENPLSANHKGFSAGSFADVSRVATINERLWAELMCENRDCLSEQLADLIGGLSAYKELIEKGDRDGLRNRLKKAREIKEKTL
jgi:prephenate dehydrogenase